MNKILIATTNKGKFQEILEVFRDLPYDFLSLADLEIFVNYPENAETFAENAKGKAAFYFEKCGGKMPVISDDSGIFVDALQGELGVKTRRWGAGEQATDEEWIDFFLKRLNTVPPEKRTARFVCAAAVCFGPEKFQIFEAFTEGIITEKLEAAIINGLPISSCFKPLGFEKVYAALSTEEKNQISHRGQAFQGLKNFIKTNATD